MRLGAKLLNKHYEVKNNENNKQYTNPSKTWQRLLRQGPWSYFESGGADK